MAEAPPAILNYEMTLEMKAIYWVGGAEMNLPFLCHHDAFIPSLQYLYLDFFYMKVS